MIGAQVTRDARIKQHIVVTGTFIAQHGGEGKEDFGNACLGIGDLGKGDLPLPLQGGDQPVKLGVAAGPETIGQQRKRLFISPELAKDFRPRDHTAPCLPCRSRLVRSKDRLRPFVVADRRQCQSLVIQHEPLHAGFFAQIVELGDGGGHVAHAHMRPSLDQTVHPRADPALVCGLFDQTRIVFFLRHASGCHQIGDLPGLVRRGHDARQRQGAVDIPQREQRQNRAFKEFGVLGIKRQRLAIILGRFRKITAHRSMPTGKIGPRRRLRLYGHCNGSGQRQNACGQQKVTDHTGTPHSYLRARLTGSRPSAMPPIQRDIPLILYRRNLA